MSTQKNKVEFGICNLHVCTYEVDDDNIVTLGTPYPQKGAVSYSADEGGDFSSFYADNVRYFGEYSEGDISGDLEVALFDDDFKTQFLGYKRLTNGGLAKVKGAYKPNVCLMFEVDGDVEHNRVIIYNCALGGISRTYNTEAESRKPVTETIPVTVIGDVVTNVPSAVLKPGDAGYDTLFTAPEAPALESE